MITLAVFDMAGTTIDEGGLVYVALRAAVETTGAKVSDENLQMWMGRDKVEAITALMTLGGEQPDDKRVAATFADFKRRLATAYRQSPPRPLPGVLDAFASLRARGVSIYLTTGFTAEVVKPMLTELGWDETIIDGWICTDDVKTGRPAPYMIFAAMERSGCPDVSQVLVAGDTVADVHAGRAAGAGLVIAVTTGDVPRSILEGSHPDAVLDSLADVTTMLAGTPTV
jgi:phosphonatase-like hydrolase